MNARTRHRTAVDVVRTGFLPRWEVTCTCGWSWSQVHRPGGSTPELAELAEWAHLEDEHGDAERPGR